MNNKFLSVPTLVRFAIVLSLLLGSSVRAARAEVVLAAIFSDNMVLQRSRPVAFWGTGSPGETVTVELTGHKASGRVESNGRWRVMLPALAAGGPYDLTVSGSNQLKRHNVLVGDVWLCAGQSNMGQTVGSADDAARTMAAANDKPIRLFKVPPQIASQPLTDMTGSWSTSTPATVGYFSAVAYYFGREMTGDLKVPIGLIDATFGGSPIDAWISKAGLAPLFNYKKDLDKWDAVVNSYPQRKRDYADRLIQWRESQSLWKFFHLKPPPPPKAPAPLNMIGRPVSLFDGMVAPLLPFSMKGVLWCQGEADVGQPQKYRELFQALIKDWRADFQQGDLPFYFVQLHNYQPRLPEPARSRLAELREAQAQALRLPHTGMVVAIDLGGADCSIHYTNKQAVAKRLASAVLSGEFGFKLPGSGPTLKDATVEGSRMRVRFNHADAGLSVKGGGPVKGFAVSGQDAKFVWANATIEGDSVLVSSPAVDHPVAVRYAWADNPDCNLVNGAGLPAVPFRTDTWERK